MKIVAATDVIDDYLDSTDHIAYQYSNLIQPHVLFLNVDRQSRIILNASTNIDNWLKMDASEVIGKTLADELFPGISSVLHAADTQDIHQPRIFSECVTDQAGQAQLCRVLATPTSWLVELELEDLTKGVDAERLRLESLLLSLTRSLNADGCVQELVTETTRRLRELFGFARGMCYRFEEDNNGEVIADETVGDQDPKYLGLRFPARDIPRTAREMLLACPIRVTRDQRLDCYPIFPDRDPNTQQYIDLTHVRGRGAAGSCREYYLNMNIRSTLVLPLIVENRLWGLLSLHDHEARCVSPTLDQHLQATAKCLSASIERSLRSSREQSQKKGSQVVMELSEVDPNSDQWFGYIQSRIDVFKNLIPCDGFILTLSGEMLSAGIVPDTDKRKHFVDQVCDLAQNDTLVTSCLAQLNDELGVYSQIVAGVIAIPLSANNSDVAIWLRADQRQTVLWAGDPLGNINVDAKGQARLSVRESFDVWARVTEKSSLPWTEQELCTANSASMQVKLLTLSWYTARANQAKTEFLSCMSHEIRTPMTAILGYANLLKEQQSSDFQANQAGDFIDVIERNGQHLLSIIDDILNLAKIEAGKLTVEQLPIPVYDLLLDVVALTKVQADAKQLEFELKLETAIPKTIIGDPVRIRQILVNLLGNAIKFTSNGKVTLKVGYDTQTRQIFFDVKDTGIGLTESQISRLFNAFAQADSSTTRRFGGSGLGLNISKNLARLLGGDITVSSEPGIGSCFHVSIARGCSPKVDMMTSVEDFPLIAEHGNRDETVKAVTTASSLPALTSLKIMLLEDGEDNQRLLRHILTKAGADVSIFSNGKVGIEAVTTDGQLDSPLQNPFPFELILTDMQMPELDGYSTAKLLRQKGCQRPIVALTAYAMQGNDEECLRAGCNDYLSKPLKREELLAMCAKWSTFNRDAATDRARLTI